MKRCLARRGLYRLVSTFAGMDLIGVGTHWKYYVDGGALGTSRRSGAQKLWEQILSRPLTVSRPLL